MIEGVLAQSAGVNPAARMAEMHGPEGSASLISPGTWSDNRDAGSVIEYKGLLVVKHTPYVHDKVKALLELMRESSAIR